MESKLSLPAQPKIKKLSDNEAYFTIENCYPGYGITLGNALRRALLSSLPGSAVTRVKIKNIDHEFSTLPGVAEDVVEILLNLKTLRFAKHSDEKMVAVLKAKGEQSVKAKDLKTPTGLEVVNKQAVIANLTDKKASLYMELEVETGIGFVPVERMKQEKLQIGEMLIDASFSPIQRVDYQVSNMRVGERTDYNRLEIYIKTDGSLTAEQAFKQAVEILLAQFKILRKLADTPKLDLAKTKIIAVKPAVPVQKSLKPDASKIKVEELKLSAQTANLLSEAGIKTVAGLARKTEQDLTSIENMGAKRIKEIRKELGKLGILLKSGE